MLRWFISPTVRQACAMKKHVHRLLSAQRDSLKPDAIGAVTLAMNGLETAIAEGNTGRIRIKMDELEFAANKWIKPYPHAMWRENVEVLLVAVAVAMAIRTFFVQPFKIPTGSMQPTLYGVTSTPDYTQIMYLIRQGLEDRSLLQPEIERQVKLQKSVVIPPFWERLKEWFQGVSYVHVVAQTDGNIDSISPMQKFLIFNIRQTITINGVEHVIWFPPDFGEEPLEFRAGLDPQRVYHKGEDVVNLRVTAGDHLFVDRFTYNFRPPQRGEIVVFDTHGITRLAPDQQNTFYIKRLIGLGGETLAIKQDYEVQNVPRLGTVPVGQVTINGQPLSASTPHFENLYGFAGVKPGQQTLAYQENRYYGHGMLEGLAPGNEFQVATNHFFVMGDNTMNSSDSRYWGDFPSDHVIGKAFFVYWPLTKRFGWGNE